MKRHHFFNMYLTTCISVALVLFLIGIEVLLLIDANQLINKVRQSVRLTIVLNDEADEAEVQRLDKLLTVAPFVSDHHYQTKEEALAEHITNLGEDPTLFLGYNPLLNSYEVSLQPEYAQTDSIVMIESKLQVFSCVNDIIYQKDIVRLLDKNIGRLSVIVLAIAAILLFVAIALIVNTIRLHIYSKRFLINTMKLVGATPHIIRRPIIGRNVLVGFVSSLLALGAIAGVVYYCQRNLGITILPYTWQNISMVSLTVLFFGLFITFIASFFAANRFIRMKTNDLYYI